MAVDDKITTADLLSWAEKRVNLSSADASAYREQGDNLKDRLAKYIEEHKAFDLVKMVNAGSVAKGTALRNISDMDVAIYVSQSSAPTSTADLVGWLRDRLREAYKNVIKPEQITSDEASVRISFVGSGIDVECITVLFDGDKDDYGELILRNGERVRTSIRKHLEFIRKRKDIHPKDFAQLLRFLKYWRGVREEESGFALPGFALDLIVTHLIDAGLDPSDYPQALQSIFAYIVKSGLKERIVFTDNYKLSEVAASNAAVQIYDPVAFENNIARHISIAERTAIVEAANDALDDITIARTTTTKSLAISAWRNVFGPEFNV